MSYISPALRQLVTERANGRCEYCHFPQEAALLAFEMEHIIAEKHGGASEAQNLALACPYCNRAKGTDLGSVDPQTGSLTPFYNPRTQDWQAHFQLEGAEIIPLTAEGRVTVVILQLNDPARIAERQRLINIGLYS
jgi:glutaredoxin